MKSMSFPVSDKKQKPQQKSPILLFARTFMPQDKVKASSHQDTGIWNDRLHFRLAGVWDIFRDAVINYRTNGDANQAAAIALYAVLSIIPFLILTLIAVSQFFGAHPGNQEQLIETVRHYYPGFSGDLLRQLGQIEVKKHVLGWVGILSLIWLSSMIFNALETALNIIFHSKTSRNYLVSKMLAISMIPMGWAVGIASIGVAYVAALLARQPLLIKGVPFVIPLIQGGLVRHVLPWLVTTVFFALVYKIIPTGRVAWRSALIGSAVFAALMEIAKVVFAWYVSRYTRYDIIFGSLETVVILVLWVFYISTILLFCAEIISSYQRRDLILLEKAFLSSHTSLMKVDERLFRKFGRMYPRGSVIFREGDSGGEMYYILSGRVCLEKQAGQVKKTLVEMGPGAYFGEMAALIESPRTATAVAVVDSDVAVIDGATFQHLLRESGEVALTMLQEFSHRVRSTNEVLEELTRSWIELWILLYLLKEWPLREGIDLKGELAALTGKDVPDISDVMGELCEQGVCTVEENRLTGFSREKTWAFLERHRGMGTKLLPPIGDIP